MHPNAPKVRGPWGPSDHRGAVAGVQPSIKLLKMKVVRGSKTLFSGAGVQLVVNLLTRKALRGNVSLVELHGCTQNGRWSHDVDGLLGTWHDFWSGGATLDWGSPLFALCDQQSDTRPGELSPWHPEVCIKIA